MQLLRKVRGVYSSSSELRGGAPAVSTFVQWRWRSSAAAAMDAAILSQPSATRNDAAAAHESQSQSIERIKPFSEIPGPKPLPILRNLLDFKNNVNRLIYFLEECYEEYGEIFKLEVPGGNRFVYMANPKMLERVMRAEGKYPRRENTLSPNLEWILAKMKVPAPFAVKSGEEWKRGRSAVSKQIMPCNVQRYTHGLNNVAARFTEYLSCTRDNHGRISDIMPSLKRLMVEMSAKFVFDADLYAFDNPSEDTEKFIEGVTLCFDCFGKMLVEPPLYKLYPNKLFRDFRKAITITRAFGMKHAERVWEKIQAREESEVQGLLEQWLRAGKMTETEALLSATDMFTAGVDSTSSQAAFLLYCMAKNPEAQERLHREIKHVLGDQTQPTPEDLAKMPYLKGCMMESFRMLSSSPLNARVLTEETTLMGYHIPAETNVGYMNFVIGKNKEFFPHPERFDPDRWARDKPNPFALLPFGFGPRACYGKRFAELKLKLFLCQMTEKFVLRTDLSKLDTRFSLVARPDRALPVQLINRY